MYYFYGDEHWLNHDDGCDRDRVHGRDRGRGHGRVRGRVRGHDHGRDLDCGRDHGRDHGHGHGRGHGDGDVRWYDCVCAYHANEKWIHYHYSFSLLCDDARVQARYLSMNANM